MGLEVIGHRGARFEVPENTLAGFQHAVALGLTTVEFDVRTTADGELVVIHDDTLDRTTNGSGKVSDTTWDGIRELDARSIHIHWPEHASVPLLGDVLATLSDMPQMQVEIKQDTRQNLRYTVPQTIAILRETGKDESAVITSFDPYVLELAQQHAPQIRRGLIGDFSREPMWYLARQLKVNRACIGLRTAHRGLVQRAHTEGYVAVAWPCNDEGSVRQVLEYGFDEVCTDAPSLFAPMFGKKLNKIA